MEALGTESNPLRVAVIGSGPSGFYATEVLLKSDRHAIIDMYERLPTPFGLVRSGVAPDHPKLKQPILVYDKIARADDFNFIGNVSVGKDIAVTELRQNYHALIFAIGAQTDRKLNIPGEELAGSHTATEFVGWYNGHPDYRARSFDLSQEVAVIIGQGNVASDVCRMLAKTVDELKTTDIAEHALEALAESKVREIHIVGRRGPAQAKFTGKELKELGNLQHCEAIVNPSDLDMNPASLAELDDKGNSAGRKNVDLFKSFSSQPQSTKPRRCVFHFLRSPVELRGKERLEQIVLEKNYLEGEPFKQIATGMGEYLELDCGLLFRSIGYRGVAIPGVPFDDQRGVIRNQDGRIANDAGEVIPGMYVTGWIKRGPTGIIGTNRADSVATVDALMKDLQNFDPKQVPGAAGLAARFEQLGVRVVNYQDWLKIDSQEIERGKPRGKQREKFTQIKEMLSILE